MDKILGFTATLVVENMKAYNESYLRFKESSRHMSQAVWWEGDKLLKNIKSTLVQNSNIKDIEVIKYADYESYTFSKDGVYYVSKPLYSDRYQVFKFDGCYEVSLLKGLKSNILILDETDIEKVFTNYEDFLNYTHSLKLEANKSVEIRKNHRKCNDLVYELLRRKYKKLGKLDIIIYKEEEVSVYFKNVLIFEGYTSDNYWGVEYCWREKGKFQEDIFILLEKKIKSEELKKEKLKREREKEVSDILSTY
jgi:hypothetical protein